MPHPPWRGRHESEVAGRIHGVSDWLLAALTVLVWGSTYGLYLMRDPKFRRALHLHAWRLRHRLLRRRGPRAVPMALTRPVQSPFPPPRRVAPPTSRSRTAAAHKVEMAEPAPRIAEWRANNLPLRYRLLGRVRRGANDN